MKRYTQFSKRIVVAVTVCVTAVSIAGVILSFIGQGLDTMADIIKVYIQYAMIVFAAYSGNSAVEKWLTKKFTVAQDTAGEESSG